MEPPSIETQGAADMSNAKESIHMGLVQRSFALGLAFIATTFIFVSIPVVFTAGADSIVPAIRVAHQSVAALPGV
jgi:hypothetical protein